MQKKVLIIIGTRPEAIKMAPVREAFATFFPSIIVKTVSTGQHGSLLRDGLTGFDFEIEEDLKISNQFNDLRLFFAALMNSISQAIDSFEPDLILVHGDTASAAAAAIAGHLTQIPIGHVEAGLRSHRLDSPWPEESNRRIVDSLSSLMFAPTEYSSAQISLDLDSKIFVTGNTVIDALKRTVERIQIDTEFSRLQALKYERYGTNFVLVTQHRRESFGAKHQAILEAIETIATESHQVLFPVHPNPAIRGPVLEILSKNPFIHLIDPVPYPEFVYLMLNARLAISDSGGIQEEAPAVGLPLLITRELTERPEALLELTNQLVGADRELIITKSMEILRGGRDPKQGSFRAGIFGDGTAGWQIASHCSTFLGN